MWKIHRDAQKERYRQIVREAKDKPCADCGIKYAYYVMQFDHRPDEEKLFNIGMMVSHRPAIKVFLGEIAKCDVVCANCHAERTFQRNNMAL